MHNGGIVLWQADWHCHGLSIWPPWNNYLCKLPVQTCSYVLFNLCIVACVHEMYTFTAYLHSC
jgi:hypothetical protein